MDRFVVSHALLSFNISQPLHEGARAGNLDVVRYLVEQGNSAFCRFLLLSLEANLTFVSFSSSSSSTFQGADINAKTKGAGGSALWWAKQSLEDEDPVVAFLESIGALEIGPDL